MEELHRIISFRNRIIHGYDTIDDAAVWGVAESDLPHLVAEVEALLEEAGKAS
ncbi:MAG TPA: HepT-like ribonuclease domain-containing protein [Thermoanaerobaculia bacterium]|nr:HepT-like ribonuclease domain-containing protein [Thermoanaerobaculia bacterium]